MRKSAGKDELQHNQRLYSPGFQGKSVPVLLSDACLKHIKTKTGSVISHGEEKCTVPSRISLEVGLIKAMPRDRTRLNQHFFSVAICLKTGEGVGVCGGGLFYTYFPFNVFAGKLQNNRLKRTVKHFTVAL